jgi:hypothetical protein
MAKKVLILLYIFNILFLVFWILNSIFSSFYLYDKYAGLFIGIILAVWFLLYIIISIRNIFYVKDLITLNNGEKLKEDAEFVKFNSIPFWEINFFIFFLLSIITFLVVGSIEMFLVSIIISYIILLGTSIFSISYIRLLYKENIIGYKEMIFQIILQLIFVLDIFGIKNLKNKYSNKKENNEIKTI